METKKEIKRKKLKLFFLVVSCIIFLAVTGFWAVLTYDAFIISKNGEFCDFKQSWETDYDFEYPPGNKCDFLISGLLEPFIIFVFGHSITQIPLWSLYWIIKFVMKKLKKNHG